MPRRGELSDDLRSRIVDLHRAGQGYRSISKSLDVHLSTVKQIVYKWRKFGCTKNRPRSGRPSNILRWLQYARLQFPVFMDEADDLHKRVIKRKDDLGREALAAAVRRLLYMCEPYLKKVEAIRMTLRPQKTPQAVSTYTTLLAFSQQLCDRLEKLVLTYANYNLLCLDEAEPNSVSHFCIGQRHCGPLRLTAFRYCQPAPYLARVDTGLYKRIRWNVKRDTETEYYLLCYEEILNVYVDTDGGRHGTSHCNMKKMWFIGRWVQAEPHTNTEDIYNCCLTDHY
ncbi:UPF0575 protein C19orf67 homolog isoform X2 [Anabas testudineus]|uniref:Sleeping Beauty transposase HTH domain-containing protein n=1 Tax=Anabas testudineus TaxID=64144 RepID=A0A3Q1HC74_ANATE|nr:UPF0575 protein C19orf67 homolog isoform X2 [Anabas testudineus]